ncbi:hypothetical protein PQX77_020222 [Marasmius sp. AFHP31]|nr:hypothetical protein PQX77_020222 [Marasmius sp. AFHP31]
MTTYFSNARGTTLGDYANFQTIAGNSTTNHYHNSERDDRVTLHGRTVRRVIGGDINFQRVLSSEILSVNVKPKGASISMESQVVKVKRMEQTATIYGYQGKFTATSFEPVAEKDREKFEEIMKAVLETAMQSGRSALLKQVFAVAESNAITLIARDELANSFKFANRYRGKEQVVFYYLNYTFNTAVQSLRSDETLGFPVTFRSVDWLFNLETLSWRYDPSSLCLNPPNEEDLRPFHFPLPPLLQDTLPHLNTAEIVACVEEGFGDVLHLIASAGNRWFGNLSNFARYNLLTFGGVVNLNNPGILAHLPSTSSPEWFCQSRNLNVKVSFSGSGRVDLLFQKTGDVKATLDFGWRIPENDLLRLCCAFLCQSPCLCNNSVGVANILYIDQLGFRLEGTFHDDPTSRSMPAYLFVKPLPTEFINNLHCLRYPFPRNLFYWSYDPQGGNAIAEEDWKRFGIPELSMEEWIGTWWEEEVYDIVQDHLCSRNFDLDGKQYACEHGYPKLIFADPHSTNWVEEEFETSHIGFSSTSSLMEEPVECTMGQQECTPMLDNKELAAATHIANKHQRIDVGRAIESCYIYTGHQDLCYKTSHGQTFKESSIQPICPLPRRNGLMSEPSISFLDFTSSSLHVDHLEGNRELNFLPYIPPSSLHTGDTQAIGVEPLYETMVNHTLSQWNKWGSPDAFDGTYPYTFPSLIDSVDLTGMSQLTTTSLHHIPFITANSSHHLAPSAISYPTNPSTTQDVPEPSGHTSFVLREDTALQFNQEAPISWPHISLDSTETLAPTSVLSAWNQDGSDERRGQCL